MLPCVPPNGTREGEIQSFAGSRRENIAMKQEEERQKGRERVERRGRGNQRAVGSEPTGFESLDLQVDPRTRLHGSEGWQAVVIGRPLEGGERNPRTIRQDGRIAEGSDDRSVHETYHRRRNVLGPRTRGAGKRREVPVGSEPALRCIEGAWFGTEPRA